MKKRIVCALLALVILAGSLPASAAFSDISSNSELWAAESLASLGIINGTGDGAFRPGDTLTRAEFCKMAVLAAGFSETSLYSSYTIFPDVPASQWYAPYVNAAVRKYQIIRGEHLGNFNPNQPITYGEAVTILLRMLGYTVEDIGYFWPRDDAFKAEQIGLNREMKSFATGDRLPRGQAAILIRNLLLTDQKEGGAFLNQAFKPGDECLLAATWETDPDLKYGEVRLFTGEEESVVSASQPLSQSLVGLRGIPVYASTGGKLTGFVVSTQSLETAVVRSTAMDSITTEDGGKITIPRSCKLLLNGRLSDYVTSYYDLRPGVQIYLYHDESGAVSLLSGGQTSLSLSSTAVYGVDNIVFTQGSTIIKNGVAVTRESLSQYDVVSYSAAEKTYYVSSDRVTLLYEDAQPTYTAPTTIKAGGKTFAISDAAADYFKDLVFNRTITLLFDYNGNVAAAFDSSRVNTRAPAILTELSGESATVKLLSGLELSGTPSFSGFADVSYGEQSASSLYRHVGRLVGVSQDNSGKLTFSSIAYTTRSAGTVDPAKETVGQAPFSPKIRIFDEPASGMPLLEIKKEDLGSEPIPASSVRHVELDASGNVTLLVLSNVTGNGFTYGLVSQKQTEEVVGTGLDGNPIYRTQYTLTVRTSSGSQSHQTYFNPGLQTGSSMVPAAVAEGVLKLSYTQTSPAYLLEVSATVGRDDFDSRLGVRVGNVFVPVADNVQVYARSIDRFLSLSEARTNFSSFDLYCDRDPGAGGTVRLIIAR